LCNLKITLRTGGSLVCLDQIKTRLRVTPLTQRQGHGNDNEGDRYGDRDNDFACPYGQRHGHGRKDTGPRVPGRCSGRLSYAASGTARSPRERAGKLDEG
jgi:hypothetical protein